MVRFLSSDCCRFFWDILQRFQNPIMGNSQRKILYQPVHTEQELQSLNYYATVEDHNLGSIPVYTMRKMPLCYILKYEHQPSNSALWNTYQQIENEQSSALIALYGFKIVRQVYCDKYMQDSVVSYWEYFNYDLAGYLKARNTWKQVKTHSGQHTPMRSRNHQSHSFHEEPNKHRILRNPETNLPRRNGCFLGEQEILHLIKICCEGYRLFLKHNIHFQIQLKSLLIAPEGKLKFFWINNIEPHNAHFQYYKFFEGPTAAEINQEYYYSPQELEFISQREYTTKLNLEKCNSFRLGIILLYCMSAVNPICCYSGDQKRTINFKQLYSLQESCYQFYGEIVSYLLKRLLEKNPAKRLGITELHQEYQHLMLEEYELVICSNRQEITNREKDEKKKHKYSSHEKNKGNSQEKQIKVANRKPTISHWEGRKYEQKTQHRNHQVPLKVSYKRKRVDSDYQPRNSKQQVQHHFLMGRQRQIDDSDAKTIKIRNSRHAFH